MLVLFSSVIRIVAVPSHIGITTVGKIVSLVRRKGKYEQAIFGSPDTFKLQEFEIPHKSPQNNKGCVVIFRRFSRKISVIAKIAYERSPSVNGKLMVITLFGVHTPISDTTSIFLANAYGSLKTSAKNKSLVRGTVKSSR